MDNPSVTFDHQRKEDHSSLATPSQNNPIPPSSDLFVTQTAIVHDLMVDRYLSHLFLQIGIPANKIGFQFLREAVQLVLQDPSLQHRLMRGLYPQIAQRHHTSVYCVEHSMRCAIASAWSRGRPDMVEKLLGRGVITPYDKPTNGEFIALVAVNIRMLLEGHPLFQNS